MIVITGAAGFIASCLLSRLNKEGFKDIVIADDFSNPEKSLNYSNNNYLLKVDRMVLNSWLEDNHSKIKFVFHLGARTNTTELDKNIFDSLNVNYSKDLWNLCTKYHIPFVYASSAATYGLGEFGYDDSHEIVSALKPLNPYGESKNDFDKWVLEQHITPPFWAGMKFFNVYGPNEYHKGRMASVIMHAFNQINESGKVKLFRSHNPDYTDGGQLRDFIYVKDLVDICLFLMNFRPWCGLYNVGTGKERSFLDLVKATFAALKKEPEIEFVDTPLDIRDKYQYFTKANMAKLAAAGYHQPFTSLEEGIEDYVSNYLKEGKYY
ncbi:MAG: ADP-glyceromanno-heptose 6-epimerase [Bacteroidetes bacterium]|nr:ADP-glyceromanno-heptose 6-epimerase [Bacteroidota bacterium]HET6245604.1 ADP-glyceromanno-heptose 6-epimerase [Bacteroidia bacterium]